MGCGNSKPKPGSGGGRPGTGTSGGGNSGINDDDVKSAKIIIMGNQKVGKTSIIKAYMESASQKGMAYV